MADTTQTNKSGLLSSLLGDQGVQATVSVKVANDVYFYTGLTIVFSVVIAILLGAILKDALIKK